MIKILAPTRNYEIARMQVEAGADELYMGVDAGDFNVYSYGGRFRRMNGVVTQVPSGRGTGQDQQLLRKENVLSS